ncbi:hypothetical protein H012_gp133 [Acanthamoeba polyphaga moumouvirus]|uniref:Transmembrane protein n=2 Tax=Moumouvirus TaxID=3080801 RepID=L7RD83_9VIRU|nr:hypothetical protein H012_gp133 [Acanthamoeba polyphaga moumouvirus]AEX62324.1 hypothetical protein mv_L119 [Moumouvirus Monve]AGC02317.1 hypothetical protein Moumou_00799 [Acanthamoeba polyphaga moumouvirus]AQN68663.1 hypothetical protein [Saudi moumouvirus]
MCWNYEVSLFFSGLYVLTNSYYIFTKPRFWREYLLFGTFYFIMEAFQTMQWLYGNVVDYDSRGVNHCDLINRNYTVFGFILIWLQPLIFSYIGKRTSYNESNKKYFNKLCIFNFLLFIYACVLLYLGFGSKNYYIIEDSIFGSSTCTNVGQTGHLAWRFKPKYLDVFPNHITYVILCMMSFLMYEPNDVRIIGWGWFLSLVVTKFLLYPTMIEIASSWCLLSIIANMLIVGYLYVK